LDQARRDFVGNISHELRTPLTVITGYLGTLLSDTERLPGYMLKPLQQMDQQADRMENLLKDLLWLARIESEEREEKREPIDIKALLQEMKDELGATHPGRRILLRLSAECRVFGDYRELYSAISNLVQNAMKYSAADTTVTVGWRVGPDGYYLSVRDQGIGIEQSHIPRLTERFYRVDDSRSSSTGGTGLGLAIVKHVAASHGARLNIESEPGKGSTFTLVFPGESVVEQASRTEQRHVQC
jgi:two-component system phosphate regulon sensor histidine kinase PhoR